MSGRFAVAVLDDYQGVARSCGPWDALDADVTFFRDHVEGAGPLAERLAPFDAVVAMRERTPFDAAVLDALPRLRLLVTTGMANASIDVAAATARGIVVCGTGSPAGPPAELTWGLILALLRHIPAEDAAVRASGWQTTVGTELAGRTLGVIGLGRLGAALHAGTIAGAGVDVFDTEPLPPDHPLRSAPNTVLTPHVGYVTTATYARFYGDAVEDIAAFLQGAPVRVLSA